MDWPGMRGEEEVQEEEHNRIYQSLHQHQHQQQGQQQLEQEEQGRQQFQQAEHQQQYPGQFHQAQQGHHQQAQYHHQQDIHQRQQQQHQQQLQQQHQHDQQYHQQQQLQQQQMMQQHPQLQQLAPQQLSQLPSEHVIVDPRFPTTTFQVWGSPASRQPQSRLSMLLGEPSGPYRCPPSPLPTTFSPLHWSPAGVPGGLLAQVFPQLPLEQPRYDERDAHRMSVAREPSSFLHGHPNLHSQQGYQSNPNHPNNPTIQQSQQHQHHFTGYTAERRGGGKLPPDVTRLENSGRNTGEEDDREIARREREEWERLEWERAEKERTERSKIERTRAERIERERIETERVERERAERERKEKERQENERMERDREEQARLERARAARERDERMLREQLEEERVERQRGERGQRDNLGPRPSPLGQDSPPVNMGKSLGIGSHKVPSWPRQAEEEGKLEVAPRRVGSGRVLSEAHVLEREAGRGAAVEEARTMMEKMRVEERQQAQGWSRERKPLESGPRPYSSRGGVENSKDWEEMARRREDGGWRAPGGVGRPSSTLTLDSFLPPEGPRPVKGRGGGRKGAVASPGTVVNYTIDENNEWNGKEWAAVKSTVVGAERIVQPMARTTPTPCKATCYWRSQDSADGPTQEVSCGRPCGLVLDPNCGHECQRTCHHPPCKPPDAPCPTPCSIVRPCGHPCSLPCHLPKPCPPLPCQVSMRIACHCGRNTSLLPCLASHSAKGSVEETAGRGRKLECREECFALLEAQEKEDEKNSLEELRAAQSLPVQQQGKKKKKKKRIGPAGQVEGQKPPGSYHSKYN